MEHTPSTQQAANLAPVIDASVIAALGARAEWAWRRLFEALGPRLAAFARGCGNSGDAEDVVADTFARAFAAFDRFDGDEAALRAWLYAIARNVMRDNGRSVSGQGRLVERLGSLHTRQPQSASAPEDSVASADTVTSLLGQLSPRQREIVSLRVVDDLSVDQVAYITQLSPGAVKTHQRRAEDRLRRAMSSMAA